MANDEEWTDDLIASLPAWTLVQASHGVARRFYATFADVGLGPTQFGVLAALAADPDLAQAELARRILVTPQSLGELLTTLEARGLVERTAAPGRGRPRPVRLTTDGHHLLARARPGVLAINAPDALGLTPDEAAQLNQLLHRVRHAVTTP